MKERNITWGGEFADSEGIAGAPEIGPHFVATVRLTGDRPDIPFYSSTTAHINPYQGRPGEPVCMGDG